MWFYCASCFGGYCFSSLPNSYLYRGIYSSYSASYGVILQADIYDTNWGSIWWCPYRENIPGKGKADEVRHRVADHKVPSLSFSLHLYQHLNLDVSLCF
jgi:hypothetical protein